MQKLNPVKYQRDSDFSPHVEKFTQNLTPFHKSYALPISFLTRSRSLKAEPSTIQEHVKLRLVSPSEVWVREAEVTSAQII